MSRVFSTIECFFCDGPQRSVQNFYVFFKFRVCVSNVYFNCRMIYKIVFLILSSPPQLQSGGLSFTAQGKLSKLNTKLLFCISGTLTAHFLHYVYSFAFVFLRLRFVVKIFGISFKSVTFADILHLPSVAPLFTEMRRQKEISIKISINTLTY